LPAIHKDVEIINYKSIIESGCFTISSEDGNKIIFMTDRYEEGDLSRVTHWRIPPENTRDLSILKENDILCMEISPNNEKLIACGKFKYLKDKRIYMTVYGNHSLISYGINRIYKITRINLEHKTFEEI
jgi:hypothetical protein